MDYEALFHRLHPGFFGQEGIRRLPEDRVFTELVMDLRGPQPDVPPVSCPAGIAFGVYDGPLDALQAAVRRVDESWVRYFGGGQRIFCALDGENVAAFCVLDDMGRFDGLRIAGPGCVGTVPEYRRRGIGLEMVRRATETLKREGFDLSWIHYTHLADWYARLGYRPELRWNRSGICAEKPVKTVEILGDNYPGYWDKVRTACRGIVILDGRILLSYETKTGLWMIPGGGLEPGEDERACCAREVAEETGVRIRPSDCVLEMDEYYEDWKYVSRYFFGDMTGQAEMRLTGREAEAGMEPRWLPVAESLAIFSRHADYAETDEMRRGIYLREYTALRELLNGGCRSCAE